MADYVFIYRGGKAASTPEEGAKVMKQWTDWFTSLGPAIKDGGNPITATRTLRADGSVSNGSAGAPTGYSIVQADSLDAALAIAKGCPVLEDPAASVEVGETSAIM